MQSVVHNLDQPVRFLNPWYLHSGYKFHGCIHCQAMEN